MANSTLVQVNGLKNPTELESFMSVSTLDTIRLALYTGWQIGYPVWIKPVTILFILFILVFIIILIIHIIRKKNKKV